jgi:hypothetical protein
MKTVCSGNGYGNLERQDKYICKVFPYNDTTHNMKGAIQIPYIKRKNNYGVNIFKNDEDEIYEDIIEVFNDGNIYNIMRLTEMQNS